MPRFSVLLILLAVCGCGAGDKATAPAPTERASATVQGLTEKEKIEELIKHVEDLPDAVFVRNGSEYDAKTAGKFLRGKWDKEANVKTAKDFIARVASVSSTTGQPYLIRFQGGREVKAGDYLSAELEKIERAER
jgi:hypothetical protein